MRALGSWEKNSFVCLFCLARLFALNFCPPPPPSFGWLFSHNRNHSQSIDVTRERRLEPSTRSRAGEKI